MNTAATAAQLAEAFVSDMRAELTDEQLIEVDELNAGMDPQAQCVTHDFLDASSVMEQAFGGILGIKFNSLNKEHVNLWKMAWALAKKSGFAWP